MIPFEEIDISLAMAETGHPVQFPPKRAEELLRVYMAWAEAPIKEIDGKRYRLIEVDDGRG